MKTDKNAYGSYVEVTKPGGVDHSRITSVSVYDKTPSIGVDLTYTMAQQIIAELQQLFPERRGKAKFHGRRAYDWSPQPDGGLDRRKK